MEIEVFIIVMKKLLYVVEAMGGGVFTYIVEMANELSKNYKVYIAYGLRSQTPKDYKNYFNKNVTLIKIENFERSIQLKNDYLAYREIKDLEQKIRPDIIHLHSSKAGVLGRIAFRNFKGPLFYTPHGYSFLMKNISKVKKNLYLSVEKMCASISGKTIACSVGEFKEAKKINSNAFLVSNGIDTNELDNLKLKRRVEKKDQLTIATLGRISSQKNPELFNKIALEFPNVKFKWIGDGNLREVLNAPNVTITGWLNRKSALKELINTDIFMLTSLWEGLPVSLLEAMYLKKLCIVSNVVGNKDVIVNDKNGFVCNDVNDYIITINKIINGDVNPKIIVKNALNDILTNYNTKVMAQKYIKIYERTKSNGVQH